MLAISMAKSGRNRLTPRTLFVVCSLVVVSSTNLVDEMDETTTTSVGPGAAWCYSCVGLHIPSSEQKTFNQSGFLDDLRTERSLQLPNNTVEECRDQPIIDTPVFDNMPIELCEGDVCAKIKGKRDGIQFVIRDCWKKIWAYQLIPEHRQDDCNLLLELSTPWAEFCICSDDLCNQSFTFVVSVSVLIGCLILSFAATIFI